MAPTNYTPNQRRVRGLGLVELMVGMVIGMVTLLVVTQVMESFEGQKRTSSGGNDAQTNGALALYLLDREIRMAGYGVAGPEGMLCKKGINTYYDDSGGGAPSITVGGAFLPIQIEDGGEGEPDAIVVMRSDAEFGAIPTSVVKDMPTPSSIITAGTSGGLRKGDLFIMASKKGEKRCTLMQMTQDPQATGNGFNLQHNPGADGPYNPSNPVTVFGEENTPKYEIGDIVINMGGYVNSRYEVDDDDQLTEVDPMIAAAPTPLVSHIVNMQAVYGIAAPGSSKITQWLPATGVWAFGAVDADMVQQIRAVRLAVVARSPQYEKEMVTGAKIPLWEGGPELSFSDAERHYRYKVFETIIPLRNIIWSAS